MDVRMGRTLRSMEASYKAIENRVLKTSIDDLF